MYEYEVSFEKIVFRQLLSRNPAHVFENQIGDLSPPLAYPVEKQCHARAIAVAVAQTSRWLGDHCLNAQLFAQLARQGFRSGFASFDLSARKLPFERHGTAAMALADEVAPALIGDQGGNHAGEADRH